MRDMRRGPLLRLEQQPLRVLRLQLQHPHYYNLRHLCSGHPSAPRQPDKMHLAPDATTCGQGTHQLLSGL
jgi:hypothetical protein